MQLEKIGKTDGAWNLSVKTDSELPITVKFKRMGIKFMQIWVKMNEFLGKLVLDESVTLSSINISRKKDETIFHFWYQASINGMSSFIKIPVYIKNRSDAEMEELLREIDMEDERSVKEREQKRYGRYVQINNLYYLMLEMEDFFSENWDRLISEDDGQLEIDFDVEESRKSTIERIQNFEKENEGSGC